MNIKKGITMVLLVLFLLSQFQIWTLYASTQDTTTSTQTNTEKQWTEDEVIDEVNAFLQSIMNEVNSGVTVSSLASNMSKREAMKQLWFSDSSIDFFDKILWEFKEKIWNYTNKDTDRTIKAYKYINKIIPRKKTSNQRKNHVLDYFQYTFQEYINEYEQNLPYFKNVSYVQLWNGKWEVKVEVPRTHTEIWFYFWDNVYKKLNTQQDGNYLLYLYAFLRDTRDFHGQLYVKDNMWNYHYYQNNRYLSYNYNEDLALTSNQITINSFTDNFNMWYHWYIKQIKTTVQYAWEKVSEVDASKYFRKFDTLTPEQQEEFYEWVRDTLTLNGMYEAALNVVAWIWLWKIWTILLSWIFKKFGKKAVAKVSAKALPFLWWAILWYSVYWAWEENIQYYVYCSQSLSFRHEAKWPLYYCGKVMVNGALVAAWVGISKALRVGAYENVKWSKLIHASQKVPSLKWKTFNQAKKNLEDNGFWYNWKTEYAWYDKFKHSDWSEVQIRPNWEVIRTQRVWTSDGSKKYPQRYDENGNLTKSHNPWEFIIR